MQLEVRGRSNGHQMALLYKSMHVRGRREIREIVDRSLRILPVQRGRTSSKRLPLQIHGKHEAESGQNLDAKDSGSGPARWML
jgi:hypothetical protein